MMPHQSFLFYFIFFWATKMMRHHFIG